MINQSELATLLLNLKSRFPDNIIKGSALDAAQKKWLIRGGWLQPIMRGWFILVRPDIAPGDSAAWYAHFWSFVSAYCNDRFGSNYCLSAENSLEFHLESPITPKQIVVMVAKGGNKVQTLPFQTSLLLYQEKTLPEDRINVNGLQIMSLPYALCKITPTYFRNHQKEVEIALSLVKAPSDLSRVLLKHEFKRAANRLLGAYHYLHNPVFVENISADLFAAGYDVTQENPFARPEPFLSQAIVRSPFEARIKAMWSDYRDTIISLFPKSKGLPREHELYLKQVEDIYLEDAYNSLSIEGYQVTSNLISQVMNSQWDPLLNSKDQNSKNALAARGYYDAFLQVKNSLNAILNGENPGSVLKSDLQKWYRNLFGPSVTAKIIPPEALAGYRNDRVFIRNSRHIPPSKDAVLDAMDAFFSCLIDEPSAAVRAILGHYIFVYIHPYMDGNGRIARFVLNTMLASGGYPWTIVKVSHRTEYIDALELAHTSGDISTFVKVILNEMKQSDLNEIKS